VEKLYHAIIKQQDAVTWSAPQKDSDLKFIEAKKKDSAQVIRGTEVCAADGTCDKVFVLSYATQHDGPGLCYWLASCLLHGIRPHVLGWYVFVLVAILASA
jgi:hypothetical protein